MEARMAAGMSVEITSHKPTYDPPESRRPISGLPVIRPQYLATESVWRLKLPNLSAPQAKDFDIPAHSQ
jgi:hypothetical protein